MISVRPRITSLPRELRQLISLSGRHQSTSSSSSVSSSEVSHFSALASSWWDPHGPSRILHLMNPLRHEFISRCRSSVGSLPSSSPTSPPSQALDTSGPEASRTLRYLDVGCGGGIFAESAARLPTTLSVTAVDPTPDVINVAKTHMRRDPGLVQSGRLQYLNTSIEDLSPSFLSTNLSAAPTTSTSPAAESGKTPSQTQIDIVTMFEVIEHVNSPHQFLEQCMQRVKPGGWLIGSTIARTLTSYFTTKLMAEDVLRIVPRGTHDWDKYIMAAELKKWADEQEGWGEWRVMGVMYVPGVGWREC
ncbi:ubiquinone biosynthesis O-methyltransferase-like protein [Elsinoe australis]|uniref:Ubiquinone biosynthesis O-methyltransferase, mitochondrial n=1 Tax=Elsinoe australis TaxID=40998 RepID=A0A4U7BD07_9PEZI|nr:ubiquinone biosynthesis O-methyltransferase-like protein [Elsinoe australis]